MKDRKTRWIMFGVTGATWSALVITMAIQPHIQVYMTVWLATLISSFTSVALWMTRPDHGLLSHVRLKLATLRLDEAIMEEAAVVERAKADRISGRLESVA
ncbi:hypothetical protein AB0F17_08840 [Nonomuraea sp. NPDC026600]|uniref:hypothetical protein n=1 Tax=Nonomuraea sp. NPDC026600 TaxID=3155363 RepID=UPI0033FDB14C